MAVRTPLYWDGTGLREMSAAMITIIRNRAIGLYAANPAVTLSVVASAGSLPSMIDTRYQAGAATSDATNFDTEAETPDISTVSVTYDKIDQTIGTQSAPADTNNIAFPTYRNATGHLQAMSYTDLQDTFIKPAIDTLCAAYTNANQGGTYYVSSSNSITGMTLVSATPIFVDTRADAAAYTSAGIPENQDQPTTITSYYLHQIDGSTPAYTQVPLFARSDGGVQVYTDAALDTILEDAIRHTSINTVNYRIGYTIGATGIARGSNMADTTLNGASADGYNTLQVGDDYRSQEFPTGTAQNVTTYSFRITQT